MSHINEKRRMRVGRRKALNYNAELGVTLDGVA